MKPKLDAGIEQTSDSTHIRGLLEGLTKTLVAAGTLSSDEWKAAFQRTYRHPFVPRVYRRKESGWKVLEGKRADQHEEWLAAVYSDDALITEVDAENSTIATSSSTQPSVMATMLEALDIQDGQSVLEIGTGTGYNAALLCARLGSDLVTSIDIEPQLVVAARERLEAMGYRPTTAIADGQHGYASRAPYNRIIATCAVRRIPGAWLDQIRPGGVIVVDLSPAREGGIVRIESLADGSARGRFLPHSVGFIKMKGAELSTPPMDTLMSRFVYGEGRQRTASVPTGIRDESFWFLARLYLPHVMLFGAPGCDPYEAPCLVDTRDLSWCRITGPEDGAVRIVTQGGAHLLWDTLEEAHAAWLRLDKPGRERYGLTIHRDRRHRIWLDTPGSGNVWSLPE